MSIVLVLVYSGKNAVVPESDFQFFFDKGKTEFEKGNYRSAVIDFKNALSLDPRNTRARRLLADTYLALGQSSVPGRRLRMVRVKDLPGLYEQAVIRFEAGDYSGALSQLKKLLKENANDAVAHLLMGQVYLEVGDGYSAEFELEKSRSGGADESLVIVPLARAYLLQKKYETLLSEVLPDKYDKDIKARLLIIQGHARLAQHEFGLANLTYITAMRLLPGDAGPIIGQARVKLEQGMYSLALQRALLAKSISPRNSEIWALIGEIHYQQGDLKQALASFSKALELAPANSTAHKGHAAVLIDLQKNEAAEQELKPVWETSPDDPLVSYLYALALARNQKLTQARTVLRDAARYINSLDPEFVQNDPSTLLMLSLINYVSGDLNNANQNLQRFIIMQPRHFGGRQLLAAVSLQRNDPAEAIRVLSPVMGKVRQDPQGLVILGSAYTRAGRYAQADKAFARAIELAPDRDSLQIRLVLNNLAAGRIQEAFQKLQVSLKKHPEAVQVHVLNGMIHLQQHQFKAAYTTAKALADREPNNPFANNIMGAALFGLGDLKQASAQFNIALEKDQDFIPARFNLAKLNLLDGNLDAARAGFTQILESSPREIGVLLEMAQLDQRFGHIEFAAKWLQRARKAEPDNPIIGMRLVAFYLRVNKFKEALEIALELESKYPDKLQILTLVSRVQYAIGQRKAARHALKSMLRLAAGDPEQLEQVAILQMQVGDMTGARETLLSVLKTQPLYFRAHILLIDIAMRRKQFARALALSKQVRKVFPDYTLGHVLEGNVLSEMHRYADAAAAYGRAFRVKPNAALLVQFYRALRDAGKASTGLPFLEAWLGKYPGDVMIRRALAAAYIDVGGFDTAIKQHEALLADFPEDAALYNNLAELYYDAGDSRALAYAKKAYERAPEQPAILDTLGWLLVRDGQARNGLKYLRQAYIRFAREPRISYHIAVALNAMGRAAAARKQLKKLLKPGVTFSGVDKARKLLEQLTEG